MLDVALQLLLQRARRRPLSGSGLTGRLRLAGGQTAGGGGTRPGLQQAPPRGAAG